jgi:PadR family transcriptional regulator
MEKETMKTELLPGTLDMLVLTSLTLGVKHGYGIAQHIKQTSEGVLEVEEGSLYPALQRLLIKGWVAAEWGHSANNRRARYYRLTPAGRKQLLTEVSSFDRLMQAIGRVMQAAEGR